MAENQIAGTPRLITIETPIQFNDPLPSEVDVCIIGGGVIGIFTALYLARMGKRVLVCEKGRVAGEQSSRNWGWIRQHGRDHAELPIMMQSLQLWHEVNGETNNQCGVVTAGTTYIASSQSEMAANESWISIARSCGLETRVLSRKEVLSVFSERSRYPWVGGVQTPSDARGEPWVAVPTVAQLACEAGALIRENCAVRVLDTAAGRVHGVVTEERPVKCEQVVLAGGAWSSIFARRHGVPIPQLAVRATVSQTVPMAELSTGCTVDEELALRRRMDGGFTIAVADKNGFYPGPDSLRCAFPFLPLLRQSWRDIDLHFCAPRGFPDGWRTKRSWSGEEVSPFEVLRVLEPEPNQRYVTLAVDRFSKRFPELGRPQILASWAGMVDAMPDVVPVVDRVSKIDGLIVATGMSGHGFGIGPGFGRIVARMVAGKDAEHDIRRFRLNRFSDGSSLEMGPAL